MRDHDERAKGWGWHEAAVRAQFERRPGESLEDAFARISAEVRFVEGLRADRGVFVGGRATILDHD